MATKDSFGKWGEEYAARYLKQRGFDIIRRNWRSSAGEIDLVAQNAETYVLCEVKARRSLEFGHPSEAVDAQRLGRLVAASELWLEINPGATVRVDVIAIVADGHRVDVEWLQGVTL
jgi:putative endonuclease